ncbi:phosphoglycerate dehydrogenase-like oxidoreductase [Owenweeksia hongkongensis DSM 17368]|uniref:Phosphoglycerate dehydrogenase-like oxidoreductase n=1 Tax=Owenweeksia hongkongensis (strain DSM 17368 / CIP 108786 / JCM 12287 / NRRL B-23963 / UST20020801) TaxID=926562 RepID=G8R0M1_OWEHD|nr:NAD(P)-dependent oxidoreductase [Owenweeksia hongkongensis]AEV32725.1 phosphoglycerate dehydrogenase-like oxidoreductase [Owenweeksia hongkongensis DSM 17368]
MKVLANDGISAAGQKRLEEAGFEVDTTTVAQEQLGKYIKENNVSALLVRSATKVRQDLMDELNGQLKLIGRGGVGMDNIDVEYARGKGIHVINTPAASSRSVAELVFAHLFGMVRYLFDSNQKMPLEGDTQFKVLKKNYAAGIELKGKTIGIIGFGRIGREVARMAYGLGMNITVHDHNTEAVELEIPFADGQSLKTKIQPTDLKTVLNTSDFVTVHVSGAGKTVIGKKEIAMMKDQAGIVNTARGGVVNEVDLIAALEEGKLRYAALDVFENEPTPAMQVLMSPYTSLTPHIGAATLEAQDRIGEELADQIISLLK